jgi:DegT/DnrJ/EryC1/StrS aminotransferase family.
VNDVCAIMGVRNLNHLVEAILARKDRYAFYLELSIDPVGLKRLVRNKIAPNNYAYVPLLAITDYGRDRDGLYDPFSPHGIYARPYFDPVTADHECSMDNSERLMLPAASLLS